jgi:2-phosphosulfolactate phosphatase
MRIRVNSGLLSLEPLLRPFIRCASPFVPLFHAMKISVYHTPEETPDQNIADCAIAIDVLRATTTIATALSVGAEAVQVFSDLDVLNRESALWPEAKRLRAGERGGNRVEGFDFGNSPLDCSPELMRDKRLFISTTNGTRALQKIEASPTVLAAALVNRKTVVDYLLAHNPETIWIVGAGWEGAYALEDTVCAGAIAQEIIDRTGVSLADLAGNDELVGAVALQQLEGQLSRPHASCQPWPAPAPSEHH